MTGLPIRDDEKTVLDSHAAIAPLGRMTPRHWAVVALLFLLQMSWSLDRALPQLLVEPIRHAFNLNDSQLGIVVGLAYGAAYGIGGLLIGPLLDRYNRARMLSGMAFLWSGFTALCALVTTFPALIAIRMGVGAAEAGGSPASYTIVSDVIPPHRRATAIGLFKMGSPLGVMAASFVAATIGVTYGWAAAFLVAGIPGILLAIAILFVVPGARNRKPVERTEAYSLMQALRFMRSAPGVPWLMVAIIVFMLSAAGTGLFQMSLFQRVHHVPMGQMSWVVGTSHAISSFSPILAALLSDRLARRGVRYSIYLLMGICVGALLFGLVMALSNSFYVAAGALLVWQFMGAGMSAPAFAALLTLTPAHIRGTVVGTLSSLMYLLAIGPAPVLTGALSDLMGGGSNIRYAIAIMVMINIVAIVCFWLSTRSLRRSERAVGADRAPV